MSTEGAVTDTAGAPASLPDETSWPVRPRTLAIAAATTGLAWVAILVARLFMGGAVGMGDEGDGRRLLCQLGVRTSAPFNASQTAHLYPTYIAHQWYGEACSGDGAGGVFRSSELWLLSMAKHLTPILGLPGALDLRALGVICAVLVGLVVAAFVVFLPGPLALRIVIASLVGLLAGDSLVAEFFISPYSEPAELIGALALCPALLALWQRGHTTWPRLAVVGFLSMVVFGAKTQAAALLPAVVIGLLWLPHERAGVTAARGRDTKRTRRWLTARLPSLSVVAIVVVATGYFVSTAPQGLSQQNVYSSVFSEILPNSPDPAADLRAMGADPSLASASGTGFEDTNAASLRPQYLKFRSEVTETTLVTFYLTHPSRLLAVGSDGLKAVDHWHQDYLGSYQPSSGHPPGSIESRLGVYQAIFRNAWEPLLVLFWLATLYVGIRTARRRNLSRTTRSVGKLAVVVAVGSFTEFWAVMVSDGFGDSYRHMALTNLLMGLGLPLMIACGVLRLLTRLHSTATADTSVATGRTRANWGTTPQIRSSAGLSGTRRHPGADLAAQGLLTTAWAAASRAMGTRNGEHDT